MTNLKNTVQSFISNKTKHTVRKYLHYFEIRKAEKLFHQAERTPRYLSMGELESLQKQYPFGDQYKYDEQSIASRGRNRAKEVLKLKGAAKSNLFLELGCGDAMVSTFLKKAGKTTTGVDMLDGFDQRARQAGVELYQMNAEKLDFDENSFDFVFSYNAFEHFQNPEKVFSEIIRVTKPGGYIFISFGPLYWSPFGEHAYRSITVPYCQVLFSKELINEFTKTNNLTPIDFNHVNGWTVESYRKVWEKKKDEVQTIFLNEIGDYKHLDLIMKYPSCFKSESISFENFTVGYIEVFFRKNSG